MRPGSAAPTVPEWYTDRPTLAPGLMPLTIRSNGGPNAPRRANITHNAGGPLNPAGGTLVYNRRGTVVPTVTVPGEGGEPPVILRGGEGPLNDPTAMMYVLEEDLMPGFIPGESPDGTEGADNSTSGELFPADGIDDRCQKFKADGSYNVQLVDPECPVKLIPGNPNIAVAGIAQNCANTLIHQIKIKGF